MSEPTPQQVLDTPMIPNEADAATIRDYLIALLAKLWRDHAYFTGKRPFGTSGWECDLYAALIKAGHIEGSFDEDGYLDTSDDQAGDRLITAAIQALGGSDA